MSAPAVAGLARGFRPLLQAPRRCCPVSVSASAFLPPGCCCRRPLSTTPGLFSGHNRWSKIRHEKGAADAKKNALRTNFTKNLTLYSQLYGADVDTNPQLATTVAAAKKAGVPKATIEGAIARGQGRSPEGRSLESATYELIMPPAVALIVDILTDNKQRVFQELNVLVKRKSGSVTPTKFFFSRMGRVVFEKGEAGTPAADVGVDEVMDDAIEAGAEDLETDEDGNIVVWTQPSQTSAVVRAVGGKFGLKVLDADIIWSANEDTRARVGSPEELQKLTDLVAALQNYPDVQAVYSNAARGDADEEAWNQLEENLDG